MSTPIVSVDRLVTGAQTDQWSLDCIPPAVPLTVVMRDKTTGQVYTVGVCVNLGAAPCDPDGLVAVLNTAGYEVWDTECP